MRKRGQAAMEYLLVAALILLIFVPTTFIFLSNIRQSSDELAVTKLNKLGNNIVNTAYEVYYQGAPAKITLKEEMPENVLRIYILNDWSMSNSVNQLIIVYQHRTINESLVFDSSVNINGSFDNYSISKGLKSVVLTANKTGSGIPFVNIKII